VDVWLKERERAHEDGEPIENEEGSENDMVQNLAGDKTDDNLDLDDLIP
jgi:hypothetical protein